MTKVLHTSVPSDFELGTTVTSYGYFILAPHRWIPAADASPHEPGALCTRLHDAAGGVVNVRITQPIGRAAEATGRPLRIGCDREVSGADRRIIRRAVRRMLRLDEDLTRWYALHPGAAARRWGRLFRSATLFEDIVRTITGCNIAWTQTVTINRLLCEHVGGGGFPTPGQLAACSETFLQQRCRTGYRAQRLTRLGRAVAEGSLDLAWFTQPDRPTDELYAALRRIHGIGDYAAKNILQHLGRYDRLPADSELVRHLRQRHGIEGPLRHVAAAAADHYAPYAPYQFLAYWLEREEHLGNPQR